MTFPGDDGSTRARRRNSRGGFSLHAEGAPSFTIVSVCTGNICRSPMSEQLFRSKLQGVVSESGEPLFRFTSGGVRTRTGIPMDETSAKFSARLGGVQPGGVVGDFRSTPLNDTLTQEGDLLLTMTRDHLVDAAKRYPVVLLRAFTLKEFARVLPFVLEELPAPPATTKAGLLRSYVRMAAANRGRVAAGSPSDDDIKDPIGRDEAYHSAVAEEIDRAIGSIATLLTRAIA